MTKQVIICVDDEKTVLTSLKAELKAALGKKYLIELAEGGEDALELLEELLEDGYEIPLIISDYLMPDMKGDELLRRVHLLSPKTLKVMLTGQATIEAVGNAINYAKLYRYLTKPWQAEDLKLTVSEAIYSYLQDKKLAEKNEKLQQMNRELEELNRQQSALIAQLHANENRLMQFLEAMPVGVFVVDTTGKPCYINQKAKELLGKGTVSDARGDRLREVYQTYLAGGQELYPKERDPLLQALNGKTMTVDDMEVHQEARVVPIEVWGRPIYDESGQIAYAIVAFQDISDRKKSETERQQFIEELFKLNCDLEIALENELKLTDNASRFVPNEFLSFLGYESIAEVKLGDAVEQEMSILFSDIRNFTTLSERMTPEENFRFINSYLSRMEPAIIENNGFIDKYIGDAIMALFGGSADDAVKAAISMLNRLVEYNQHRMNSGYSPIQNGIGINTGSLMLGTVGGSYRMDSTVISDAVNLASRVESLTKNYGVCLLITHQTLSRLQNPADYHIRTIDTVKVKGKSEFITVYEVFDADDSPVREGKLATADLFEEALMLYNQQSFQAAAQRLTDCLRINPQDSVAQIYLQRARERF
ncbi:adenylate/guanylate cyclase domain-containing protein [Phormidium sp. CCY1219]|uniref:adenylate/guanylate cyclase domain-containing protein n=1 Tax=Phormidium sp. CCY1219 TaxID=2886104 RepID=UPI002D1E65FE|nr:adenylate/guanylate cyclase domain-containing protein [Phormidium sp. CCY1219]MEB3827088.1 response regulator [Phormidium sp. CCY1219]